MTAATAAVLTPRGDARMVLESVRIEARLKALYSEVEIVQTYRNLEDDPIEAVYTFPLPLDAMLLDLQMEINGETLIGRIQPLGQAEVSYEEAMVDGDSALLLKQVSPGLFTMNVGNLLAGETAVVRFRYAWLHHWQGDHLRFQLPTTIAPRYGDPAAAGLAPHEVPEHVLMSDRNFSLRLCIEGSLAQAELDCPSHPVSIVRTESCTEVTLAGERVPMDRDFVLLAREPERAEAQALQARDGDASVVMACFHPVLPERERKMPRCLTIVVDCSGSMAGDSIAQARRALQEILDLLEPGDRFDIVTFGTLTDCCFGRLATVDEAHLRQAHDYVERIQANMGGTAIADALDVAYRIGRGGERRPDVLLITDGETWDSEPVIETARRSGRRVFTVGVGSAVSEGFVRDIARATAAACECVAPREGMAEVIVRQFRRLDQPRARSVHIDWPVEPVHQTPSTIEDLFAGDTLHVFAGFREPVSGRAELVVELEDGRRLTQSLVIAAIDEPATETLADLPRVAAHARLAGLDPEEATEVALRYRLVTEKTGCILVHAREAGQKGEELPRLRKVPQVLAAGWGGAGSVETVGFVDHAAVHSDIHPHGSADRRALLRDSLDMPVYSRRRKPVGSDAVVDALNRQHAGWFADRLDIETFEDLLEIGFDASLIIALKQLSDGVLDERQAVILLLSVLAESERGQTLHRRVRRLIRKAALGLKAGTDLRQQVEVLLAASLSS